MKFTIYTITFALLLTSCTEESPSQELESNVEDEYLIFGQYYGFCVGEGCIEIFKITKSDLYEDTNDFYPSSIKNYDGDFVRLDESQFNKLKNLSFEIPSQLYDETETVIGLPDAADGGGIYLELADGNFWLIDMNEYYLPEYLHPLRHEIRTAISRINE